MTDWTNVIADSDLEKGDHVVTELDGCMVVIFRLDDDSLRAVEDVCPHDGGELASGLLDDDQIICGRHGARFCLRTGEVLSPPAYEDIATFPVRVENGWIQVRDSRWD